MVGFWSTCCFYATTVKTRKYCMEFNPKTFCSAPWFQIRNEQFGQYKSCPVIDESCSKFKQDIQYRWPTHTPDDYLQSQYTVYLRKNLTEGVKLPECHRCWTQEENGNRSVRQELNNTISNNRGDDLTKSWIKPYLDQKTDYSHDHLVRADVKLTNTCNFSCAMCNPSDSSKIYTEWSTNQYHPVVQERLRHQPNMLQLVKENYKDRNNHKLLELLLNQQPAYLKLLGGEPLLDKQALSILKESKSKRTSLLFVTNGSVDLVSTSEQLADFRDVNYVVSLDGIGAVQDYIRKGSNWTSIANNIDQWLEQYPKKKLSVHVTVQALNIKHLPALFDWVGTRNIVLGVNILSDPDFLSIAVVPPELRIELALPNQFDLFNTINNATFDPDLLAKFKKYIAYYDPEQKWRSVFPEWINVL
jgi:organic radical activating enzyme